MQYNLGITTSRSFFYLKNLEERIESSFRGDFFFLLLVVFYIKRGQTKRMGVEMTNQQKDELRRLVKHEIEMGRSLQETIAKLKGLGYCISTIRHYYSFCRELVK